MGVTARLNHLEAQVSGNYHQAHAKVSLIDDVLPYGDVFQAPMRIKQAQVDIVWQNLGEQGWRIWLIKSRRLRQICRCSELFD
ncbi:possible exported protein [Vibrio ponticus]|nr:possible exported protein [Vibrio ponticus]